MANPQKENGYTPIANEIMEALARTYMPSNHWRCLMFILRYIYGWTGKYCVKASNTEIANGTGISRGRVSQVMKSLVEHRILRNVPPTGNTCDKTVTLTGNTLAKTFEFNKNYEEWVDFKSAPRTGNKSVPSVGNIIPINKSNKAIVSSNSLKFNKKTGCPSQFPVLSQMKSYAASKGYVGDLEDLTEGFTQYHKSKGSKFVDWYAAWQRWLRKEIEWKGPGTPATKKRPIRAGDMSIYEN